ncbi:MAG: bifunctional metallophosphatase/5'-nucleotidase [Bacteroidales bacterium]|nr:bifunctional metallophosphatase/5'-nucleotidase [Candidatus Cacconaster merdequi]
MKERLNSFLRAAIIIICIIAAGFAAGYGIGMLLGGKSSECTVTLCQTTDTHGAYFDSLYVDGEANETSFANVASYLKALRSEGEDPILIDCGDIIQGDNASYFYNFVDTTDRHLAAEILDYLDYDVAVVGNHDVEPGHPVYDRYSRDLNMPLLAANAICTGGKDEGKSYFPEYAIVKRNGVKVAVIGMTNANISQWLPAENWAGLEFQDISTIAQEVIDKVRRKEKPHIVVLAVHSGAGNGEDGLENEAIYLAESLKGVDVVLYGHDHQAGMQVVETSDGRKVSVLNAGTKNENVARCDIHLTLKHGKVKDISFENSLIPMEGYNPDSDYCTFFKPMYAKVREFAGTKVGSLSGGLDFSVCVDGPSAALSLIHAVQLDATGADISFSSPLTTKGNVDPGVVTFRDLVKLYRFENTLNKVSMTGRQIKDYLEYSYDHWVRNDGPYYNFDSAEGIDYEVSRSAAYGERVHIFSMSDGRPFSYDETYSVAMNSYRSSGGGDILEKGAGIVPSDLEILGSYKDIRSLVRDYISQRGNLSPEAASNWKFVK